MPLADEMLTLKTVAEMTQGYVGADIEAVHRGEAAMLILRENMEADEISNGALHVSHEQDKNQGWY